MNELSLFSGAGGGLLATKHLLGWNTIGYVEYDEYCQKVLIQRIKDGYLDPAPIFGDIRNFIRDGYAEAYKGMVDVITAGWPCQKFSTAHHGRATAEDLWPDVFKVVCQVQPRAVWCENVSEVVVRLAGCDLASLGYSAAMSEVGAQDVGADHIRKRFWLLAYPNDKGEFLRSIDAKVGGLPELENSFWQSDPRGYGIPDGVACGVDRLKAAGNGQVPAVVELAWRVLSGSGG